MLPCPAALSSCELRTPRQLKVIICLVAIIQSRASPVQTADVYTSKQPKVINVCLLIVIPIHPAGWFKHKTPNSFRRQCPRRF